MSSKRMVWKLNKRLFRINPVNYTLYFLLGLLWSATPLICAYIVKALFDAIEVSHAVMFYSLCCVYLLLNVISISAVKKTGILEVVIRFITGKLIIDRVVDSIINSKQKNDSELGGVLDIVNYDVDALEYMLLTQLDLTSQLFYIGFAIAALHVTNAMLTLYVVLPIILISILFWLLSKKYKERYSSAREESIDYSKRLSEFILNRESIQFMANIQDIEHVFSETCYRRGHTRIRKTMFGFLFKSLTQSISTIGVVAILFLSIFPINGNSIQIGELILFIAFVGYGCSFLDLFAVTSSGIRSGEDSLTRLVDLVEKTPEETIISITDSITYEKPVDLEITSISFEDYRLTCDDCPHTFVLKTGDVMVVSGPNKSGKTKFLDSILGYSPYFGKIEINKIDEGVIGYVSQNIRLFDASIDENINLFLGEKLDSDGVLCIVNAADRFGKKNKDIGVNGTMLSEGQRQRVSLARAIYNDQGLLILDNAFVYLDKDNRKLIFDNIVATNKILIVASNDPYVIGKASILMELKDQKIKLSRGGNYENTPSRVFPFLIL